ncbi:MAG TPA: response regulator transcription factor [Lacunisphaera sp.]|nr:response regulator transcription factor [Lacunisphaera sp.]
MNILIAEDHIVFRETLERACADVLRDSTVTSVSDGTAAIRFCQSQSFALFLLDLQLPDLDSFTVADIATAHMPNVAIIALCSHCTEYTVYRAEKRRVRGFIDARTATISVLHEAITRVAAHGIYYSPTFLELKAARKRNSMSFDKILSDRELEVLSLIAAPFTDREIAATLGISAQTAEKHRFNLLRKLGLPTTTELTRFARDRGIIRRPAPFSAPTAGS